MKKVLPHEKELMEQFVVEGLVKGYSNSELLEKLQKEYPHSSDEDRLSAVRCGGVTLRESVLTDVDKIIPYHISLYERIYKEFEDLYYIPGKLKALRQKEKLVGLHKEVNAVEIYNEVNVETDQTYDVSRLSPAEQKVLSNFIKRASGK